MWLKAEQTGRLVRFELELSHGAPSYNSGWITGEFDLDGATGVFSATDNGACELTFTFGRSAVSIHEDENKQACGFGYNVHANGTLVRKTGKKPQFSVRDPRSSAP